jgi:hypothetical protein
MLLRIKKNISIFLAVNTNPPPTPLGCVFFSSSLFIYFKKGIGNFYNKLCNWYNHETYKIYRYLLKNEYKAKIRSDSHGGLLPWILDVLDCRHITHNSRKG